MKYYPVYVGVGIFFIFYLCTPFLSILWLLVAILQQDAKCQNSDFSPTLSTFLNIQAFIQIMWFYTHQKVEEYNQNTWDIFRIVVNICCLLSQYLWAIAGAISISRNMTCHDENEFLWNITLAAVIITFVLNILFSLFFCYDLKSSDDEESY